MSAATFNSLIADKLAGLTAELGQACESLSKERESQLRNENQQLRKENAELRGILGEQLSTLGATTPGKSKEATLLTATLSDNAPHRVEPPTKFLGVEPSDGPAVSSTHGIDLRVAPERKPVESTECDLDKLDNLPDEDADADEPPEEFNLLPELGSPKWDQNANHKTAMELADAGYAHRDEPVLSFASKALVMDPSSNARLTWDILGIPILTWDLITIPMQVFELGGPGDDMMGIADWVTLVYWTIDVPASFLTGFYDSEGNAVLDMNLIARHYIHGPFGLDCFIIGADWLGVIMEAIGSGDGGLLSNVAVLRILRISRFARLLRLRKLQGKLQALEDLIDSEWIIVMLNMVTKVFSILVINHYMGCGWYWIGNSELFAEPSYRWLSSLPYPQYDSSKFGYQKLSDAPWSYKYSTCLHWALAQITPGPNNIQPQNVAERIYAVCILLFGMIIFSSFVASVTQARMQMAKMMSKFERDFWLLRKFCRQHKITPQLRGRMKRYIDYVLVPAQQRLNTSDLALIPKLSPHLRLQLNNEMNSQSLGIHPFFRHLMDGNQSVMDSVCSQCIEQMSFARGDVAFVAGQVARFMLLVIDGYLDYIPISKMYSEECVDKGTWVSEACFWTKWMHQGQLQASIESKAMMVDGAKLRDVLLHNGLVMAFAQQYGMEFCMNMSKALWETGMPTDLQVKFAIDIKIAALPKANCLLWNGNPFPPRNVNSEPRKLPSGSAQG
jgi:hypothetical protein